MPAGPKNALAAWGVSALRPVLLPSGMRALVKLPDVAELMTSDQFPQELRAIAAKHAADGKVAIEQIDPKDYATFIRFRYELAARCVKYLAAPGTEAWDRFKREGGSPTDEGWEPVTITPEFLASESDVDQRDVEALVFIAGRTATPNEVTRACAEDLGVEDPSGTTPTEDGGRVSDYAAFRGEQSGGPDGDDRPDVRPQSGTRLSRRHGSSRRVRR